MNETPPADEGDTLEDDNTSTTIESDANSENSNEEDEMHDIMTPRINRRIIDYHESSLSGDEIEDDYRDPSYRPGDRILKVKDCDNIPMNYEDAMKSQNKMQWKHAMEKELQSLKDHNVWDIVKLTSAEIKPIRTKWVYTLKKNQATNEETFKARLVAVGCAQKYGINYEETFSPVIKSDTLRTLIAYTMMKDYNLHHFDVETAYLYGRLEDEIYLEQPKGFEENHGDKRYVCKLNKAIYGLRQSGRIWYDTIEDYLSKIGFKCLKSDKCVFIYSKGESKLIIGLYVDDLIIINSDEQILNEVISKLSTKFKIKDVTNNSDLLGMEIERNPNEIIIRQEKYTRQILRRFGMEDACEVSTPMDPNVNLDEFEGSKPCNATKYQELIGSLMYLVTKTRPDITFPVTILSKYNRDPRKLHLTAAMRILKYLKKTINQGLTYRKGKNELKSYTDASWKCRGGAQMSVTGFTYQYGENVIAWCSKTQKQTALSSCDAELAATTNCVRKGIYLRELINELTDSDCGVINILNDNQSSIFLCKNGVTRDKTQHLIRNISFVYEQLKCGVFELSYIPSELNYSDILTKPLTNLKHVNCLKGLGII